MEQETKMKEPRNFRMFDVAIAVFIAVLAVVVVLQATKLEALRREVKLVKESKFDDKSLHKVKDKNGHQRDIRSIDRSDKVLQAMQKTSRRLEDFKKQLIGKWTNRTKECRKVVCVGQKGEPGPRGLKGDIGDTRYLGEGSEGAKGQKGEIGPRGPPGPSLQKPLIAQGPSDVTGKEGDTVLFSCEAKGNPIPDQSWKINGKMVQSRNSRIKITGDGRLQISKMIKSDIGTVKCIAKNVFGEASAEARLNINTIPSMNVVQREVFVNVDADAQITCTGSGIPLPTISWKRVNGEFPENAKATDKGSLAFKRIREVDSGTYKCIGENTAGKAEGTVVVFVRAPPKVDVPAKEVLSYTGKEVIEIACKVSGLPKADISWHKVNGRIPASAVVKSNGNLVLKNLSTADAGFYKCIGKNDLGTSDAVAEVRVQGMSTGMRPKDCKGILTSGNTKSGKYLAWVDGFTSVPVFCDMETEGGGWTLIQRRLKDDISFDRGWTEYKQGFGDLDGSFWLGLENIHILTKNGPKLRIDLEDFTGDRLYAEYSLFRLGTSDQNYKIHIEGFSGNATDSLSYHDDMPFSTKGRDNDNHDSKHCAEYYSGGWWYRGCHKSNLNGIYPTDSQNHPEAISWYFFRGRYGFIKTTEMKIRIGG